MPTSYARHEASRPLRYRTPSPPRYAVEAISPTASASFSMGAAALTSPQNKFRNSFDTQSFLARPSQSNRHRSKGSMEIFADIALSTQSTTPSQAGNSTIKRSINGLDHSLPPSKRAKSEKLPSPEIPRKQIVTAARPSTSHEQTPQSRMIEAELLLNFSQAARRAFPSPATVQSQYARQASQSPRNPTPELSILPSFLCQLEEASQNTRTLEKREIDDLESPDQHGGKTNGTVILPSQVRPPQHLEATILGPQTLTPKEADPMDAPKDIPNMALIDESKSTYNGISEGRVIVLEATSKDLSQHANSCGRTAPSQKELGKDESGIWHSVSTDEMGVSGRNSVTTSNAASSRIKNVVAGGAQTDDPPEELPDLDPSKTTDNSENEKSRSAAFCAACRFRRNSSSVEGENNATSWINCDGCKSWFHFACAGFKNEREVRAVDKFRCKKCKSVHGATTYVRKSSRAHSAIDYAGLHQGVIKTSDERMEHHYIQPIKDSVITFLPENFARMHPELVTAEFFEKSGGMKEPVVIPAIFNPRPSDKPTMDSIESQYSFHTAESRDAEDAFGGDPENQTVPDEGQDALDMVIPQGLTVRQVAELYGPEEKVEVIDVKSQNGENKKWNMRRWAEYYENPNNKVVRNVISLEVSQSKLGRLIRRPKIVRDLDLQDSVWPEDLLAKGEYPRVQFYCLMSVADCFTDFHIDFGGSSVFYHILKGKKTFLFIPPKEKHLKKYEEWCMSPAQNWTFLADQTKECYRVDLSEGDTMLIPSGWIHAVWTPEDSLVIGGNFLTRMNFGMQLRIAQVEKATGVARKFRYPHFQKLHWYTAFRYMEKDPLPEDLKTEFHQGGMFAREQPIYYEFDTWGENSRAGKRNYNARYYSRGEIEGLRDLTAYLLRTVLIDLGKITEGVTAETRNAIKKSIPRSHGEPLDVIKNFAAWCAWKRGNEVLHHWAYPDSKPEDGLPPEKLSTVTMKKLDREAALEAALQAPRRQSMRMQSMQGTTSVPSCDLSLKSPALDLSAAIDLKTIGDDIHGVAQDATTFFGEANKNRRISSGNGVGSNRKTACEACRKRRRACKHKDQIESHSESGTSHKMSSPCGHPQPEKVLLDTDKIISDAPVNDVVAPVSQVSESERLDDWPHPRIQKLLSPSDRIDGGGAQDQTGGFEMLSGNISLSRPRTKACNDCRKSKRRCVHDAFGNEDPIKVAEQAIPRPHARKNHKATDSQILPGLPAEEPRPLQEQPMRMAPIANMVAPIANMIATPKSLAKELSDSLENTHDGKISNTGLTAMIFDTPVVNTSLPVQALEDQNKHESQLTKNELDDKEESYHEESAMDTEAANEGLNQSTAEQPLPSSSLISPPASSNDDVGSSPINGTATYSPSPPPSKQILHQAPKEPQQRYTPESGSLRRASSSSFEQQRRESFVEKVDDVSSAVSRQDVGMSPNVLADSESLRLIKKLQAQDYGLRRRGNN